MADTERARRQAEALAQRKRVGKLVRRRRQELGLSQKELARALGYTSGSAISQVETGRTWLPLRSLHEWAKVLRLPRLQLLRLAIGAIKKIELGGRRR